MNKFAAFATICLICQGCVSTTTSSIAPQSDEDAAIAAAVYRCLFKDRVTHKNVEEPQKVKGHDQLLSEYTTLLRAIFADGIIHPQEREVICARWVLCDSIGW